MPRPLEQTTIPDQKRGGRQRIDAVGGFIGEQRRQFPPERIQKIPQNPQECREEYLINAGNPVGPHSVQDKKGQEAQKCGNEKDVLRAKHETGWARKGRRRKQVRRGD